MYLTAIIVSMRRYWHDHASYEFAAHLEPLPPEGSSLYNFPKDLAKPDILFFLNGALSPFKNNATTVETHENLPFGKKYVKLIIIYSGYKCSSNTAI